MFKLMVVHYGQDAQQIDTFKKKTDAERNLHQQAEIVKGYAKSTGWIDGMFIVFGADGTFQSRFYITK